MTTIVELPTTRSARMTSHTLLSAVVLIGAPIAKERFARLDRHRIHYLSVGSGKRAVVFVPLLAGAISAAACAAVATISYGLSLISGGHPPLVVYVLAPLVFPLLLLRLDEHLLGSVLARTGPPGLIYAIDLPASSNSLHRLAWFTSTLSTSNDSGCVRHLPLLRRHETDMAVGTL